MIFAEASTQNRESSISSVGTGERIAQNEIERESDKTRQDTTRSDRTRPEATGHDPKQQDTARSDGVRSGFGKKRKELRIIGK
jgi:hypothetical protein